MPVDSFECPEISGKTVSELRVFRTADGCEIAIEFTDGTSFSCVLAAEYKLNASLIRTGVGIPAVLREYLP
jgi:hypothetical protein